MKGRFKIACILAPLIFLNSCIFTKSKTVQNTNSDNLTSVYSYSLKSLDGTSTIDLSSYKGKKILIVNTASKCGYTTQYKALQELATQYKDKLVVIGCPCNQFGAQEPGTSEEIAGFCEKNYGVTFPLSEKLDVKGDNQHPLYKWLTSKESNGALDANVTWNFCKFLLNEEGKLLGFFPSKVKPNDSEIIDLI